jgi:hemerythrin
MDCLEWSEEFSVGVDQLDEEHIALFALFNDVCAAVEEGRPPRETETLLRALLDETSEHFASEERLIAATGYPGLTEHADHHRELSDILRKYIGQFERRDSSDSASLISFLRQWLTRHVLYEDHAYGAWINAAPVAEEPRKPIC